MESPRRNGSSAAGRRDLGDRVVKPPFHWRKAGNWRFPIRRENEIALFEARKRSKDFERRGAERDFIRAAILRSLAGKHPNRLLKTEFGPTHARDFIAPLASQCQQPHEWRPRPTESVDGVPNKPEFRRLKHTIALAAFFACRSLDVLARAIFDNPAANGPLAHYAKLSEHPIGGDRRSTIGNRVEQIVDIGAPNLRQAPPSPAIDDIAVKNSLGLSPIPCVRLRMPLDELLDDTFDKIVVGFALRPGGGSGGRLLPRRVFTLGDPSTGILGGSAGRLEVESRKGTEGQLSRRAAGRSISQ